MQVREPAALEQRAQVQRVRLAEVEISVAEAGVDLHRHGVPLGDLERAQEQIVVERLRGETHATVAPRAPTRSSSRRISVPSPAAPPPVLSAMSASTMGRPSAASACATASFTGRAVCTNSCRCAHATRLISEASRSASGWSSSVTT